jgi:hypothetical protein
MCKKIIIKVLGIFSIVMFLALSGFSQIKSDVEIIEAIGAANCEFVAANFDSFAQGTKTDKNIIIVSYKGKNETKLSVEKKRLEKAKEYLTDYYKETPYFRSVDKVITAVGLNAIEKGKLDFYVDGQLQLTITFLKNQNLFLSPCYSDS